MRKMTKIACLLLLVTIVPFSCLETLTDDSADIADTYEKRCPPGLWCGKKRSATGDKTETSRSEQILASSFEKRCPPGLWCGKKRNLPETQLSSSDVTTNKLVDTFEKRCPPGLWCGKKREISEQRMVKNFEKRCPPGLWCGKKRRNLAVTSGKLTTVAKAKDIKDQFEKRCPPGLWCGKKRGLSDTKLGTAENNEDNMDQTPMKTFEKRCPPGLWCGKKREVPEEETTTEGTNYVPITKVFEKRCPPGLWCGRKRGYYEEIPADSTKIGEETEGSLEDNNGKSTGMTQATSQNENSSLKAFEKRCPPGLWCGK